MKKILTFVFVINALMVNAQGFEAAKKSSPQNTVTVCSPLYFGASMGINNPYGILGINFEVPVSQQFTIAPGVGLSTWGTKFGGILKFYTKPCSTGWAYGLGLTYSKGSDKIELPNIETKVMNGVSHSTVTFKLKPQVNLAFNAYKYWKIKTYSRLYVHAGLSFTMSQNDKLSVLSNHLVTSSSLDAVKTMSPGGLSLGLGFQMGVKPK
ncbi:MAG: hypothetical protein RI955_1258 [Bacteroidota bacterium]